jgi:hypothetical protein
MEGVKSKNARQRAECLEAMGSIIQDYGKIEIVTVNFFLLIVSIRNHRLYSFTGSVPQRGCQTDI